MTKKNKQLEIIQELVKYFENPEKNQTLEQFKQDNDVSELTESEIMSAFVTRQFKNHDLPYEFKFNITEENKYNLKLINSNNNSVLFARGDSLNRKNELLIEAHLMSLVYGKPMEEYDFEFHDNERLNDKLKQEGVERGILHYVLKDRFTNGGTNQLSKHFPSIANITNPRFDRVALSENLYFDSSLNHELTSNFFNTMNLQSSNVIRELVSDFIKQSPEMQCFNDEHIDVIVDDVCYRDNDQYNFELQGTSVVAFPNTDYSFQLFDVSNNIDDIQNELKEKVGHLLTYFVEESSLDKKQAMLFSIALKFGVGVEFDELDPHKQDDIDYVNKVANQNLKYFNNLDNHDFSVNIKVNVENDNNRAIIEFKDGNNVLIVKELDGNSPNFKTELNELTGQLYPTMAVASEVWQYEGIEDRDLHNINANLIYIPAPDVNEDDDEEIEVDELSNFPIVSDKKMSENNIYDVIANTHLENMGMDMSEISEKFDRLPPMILVDGEAYSFISPRAQISNRILQKVYNYVNNEINKLYEDKNISMLEFFDLEDFHKGNALNKQRWYMDVDNYEIGSTGKYEIKLSLNTDEESQAFDNVQDLSKEVIDLYQETLKEVKLKRKNTQPKP